jgi:hypothetical protein
MIGIKLLFESPPLNPATRDWSNCERKRFLT